MLLDQFDFELPADRIATHPLNPRDSARLLVLDGLRDRHIRDLPELLAPGDVLVVNDTKVRAARVFGRRASGGKVELLLLRRLPSGEDEALARANKRLRPGEVLAMDGGASKPRSSSGEGAVWRVRWSGAADVDAVIDEVGHVPLPPYIKRADDRADRTSYQTVFAAHPGSAAAPTAGLHFTQALLDRIVAEGVVIARVTLHVGYGTFQPIEAAVVEEHRMHAEDFEVTEEAARTIAERSGRLIAVGTTSARVLETLAATGGIRATAGRTDIFLHPGNPPRAIDGLLTNFHLPKSSLLLLVCGLAGTERILAAYEAAVERGYRFYSYGDAMLIL